MPRALFPMIDFLSLALVCLILPVNHCQAGKVQRLCICRWSQETNHPPPSPTSQFPSWLWITRRDQAVAPKGAPVKYTMLSGPYRAGLLSRGPSCLSECRAHLWHRCWGGRAAPSGSSVAWSFSLLSSAALMCINNPLRPQTTIPH